MLKEFNLPRILIIIKLDRENSDYKRTVETIRQVFGRQAVPIQLPIGAEDKFTGVVDLISRKAGQEKA